MRCYASGGSGGGVVVVVKIKDIYINRVVVVAGVAVVVYYGDECHS